MRRKLSHNLAKYRALTTPTVLRWAAPPVRHRAGLACGSAARAATQHWWGWTPHLPAIRCCFTPCLRRAPAGRPYGQPSGVRRASAAPPDGGFLRGESAQSVASDSRLPRFPFAARPAPGGPRRDLHSLRESRPGEPRLRLAHGALPPTPWRSLGLAASLSLRHGGGSPRPSPGRLGGSLGFAPALPAPLLARRLVGVGGVSAVFGCCSG